MWILFGICSVVFTFLGFHFIFKDNKKFLLSILCALSFASLTTLFEYFMVNNWVLENDVAAIMDVVPTMSKVLTIYLIVIIAMNTLSLTAYISKKN